jgi:hypothetical protein
MTEAKRAVLIFAAVGAVLAAWLFRDMPLISHAPTGARDGTRSSSDDQRRSATGRITQNARASFEIGPASSNVDPGDRPWLDSILLADQFDSLLARAQKDPAFAYSLSHALYACSRADRTFRGIQDSLARRDPREHPEIRLKTAEAEFAKCSGLRPEQMDHRYELLNRAAAAGVLDAQLNYRGLAASDISNGSAVRIPNRVDEIRTNVEAVTVAAARTGDKKAVYNAYALYADGLLLERDNVLAYQYLSEAMRVSPQNPNYPSLMKFLTSQMSPDELRRAQAH